MAWDDMGDGEYSGDMPMDAFGTALSDIAAGWAESTGGLPTTEALMRAMRAALERAPADAYTGRDRLDALLARTSPPVRKAPRLKRIRAKAGDVLRIPYDGARAVYGRVLAEAPRGLPEAPLIVVLDRDVLGGDDLASVPDSPWLLKPVSSSDYDWAKEGWAVLGNVALRGAEQRLPTFWTSRGPAFQMRLFDYFGAPLEETPENRRRLIPLGSASWPSTIRAAVALLRSGQPLTERASDRGLLVEMEGPW